MRFVVAAVALATLIGGCAVQGKAVEAHFWDPCTELSDQALKQAGAKPETKDGLVQFSRWHICGWQTTNKPYRLGIYSAEDRLSVFEADRKYFDFRSVSVNGRQGVTYLWKRTPKGSCTVGFDTQRGSIHVEMTRSEIEGDACPLALAVTRTLLPYLPD